MKSAVITFPGSNCDRDMRMALKQISGKEPLALWHGESSLPQGIDFIALPGGFSYGDYLRCGAIAARSPIMQAVVEAAKRGVYVLGVCNGFQILTETGLLPGALMRNRSLSFICRDTYLRVEQDNSVYTQNYKVGQVVRFPVAHHDGNYTVSQESYRRLEDNNQIAFRYSDAEGRIDESTNLNGSMGNIAGILNEKGNVLGMMPHPERAVDALTAGIDGIGLFGLHKA